MSIKNRLEDWTPRSNAIMIIGEELNIIPKDYNADWIRSRNNQLYDTLSKILWDLYLIKVLVFDVGKNNVKFNDQFNLDIEKNKLIDHSSFDLPF